MRDEIRHYVLGEEVTEEAANKERRGTAVVSVRLSADELAKVEAACRATGKTLSQVVRDAVRTCLHEDRHGRPIITVSVSGGATISTGGARQSTMATVAETHHTRERAASH